MKGFPKTIGTGQDLYNCLALVKAGELGAEELRRAMEGIEARAFLHCPIVTISEDRTAATVNYCAEATAGQTVNGVKVESVAHTQNKERAGTGGDRDAPTDTALKLAAPLPEGVEVLLIPSPVDPLAELGITREQFEAIKEELWRNYNEPISCE